ncbi:aldehyde dehydrogenase family protein [Mesorhizobium atlanticum]
MTFGQICASRRRNFSDRSLVVIPFDTPEQAIAIANGTDYGLAAGIFTRDLKLALWTADRLVAGQGLCQ